MADELISHNEHNFRTMTGSDEIVGLSGLQGFPLYPAYPSGCAE